MGQEAISSGWLGMFWVAGLMEMAMILFRPRTIEHENRGACVDIDLMEGIFQQHFDDLGK